MMNALQQLMRKTWAFDMLCLAICFLVFYFLWLGSYPLFIPDEGRYSEVAREMLATSDFITPRVNGVAFLDKPALYYWLQAIAIQLFGIKEWALRFFPVLLGLMTTLYLYFSGRRLFDRRTGLLAAIILATTPLFFAGTHYANFDLEIAAWVSCCLLSLINAFQSDQNERSKFFVAAYVFSALAFLTKGLIGIAFPAMIGGLWILLMSRWDILLKMHLVKGIGLFLLITLPWYILVQRANPEFLHYFFVTQQVTRFLSNAEFNNQSPVWFYLPIIFIGFFPWTIFLIQSLNQAIRNVIKNRAAEATNLFLLLWVGIILVFFSIPHSKIVGYILPVFPALALLVGRYLALHWSTTRRAFIANAVGNFAIFSVLLSAVLLTAFHYEWQNLTLAMKPYIVMLASILIGYSIVLVISFKRQTVFTLFIACVSASVLFLLTVTLSAKHLNQNTTKPLVMELKTMLRTGDEVVNYFKFYQDIPIYLGQRITLVADWKAAKISARDNWVRELSYGMPFQNTDDWLISEETFWQRWNSNKRVFVFVNVNYFAQFKAQTKRYYRLGNYNDVILLSNQPTIEN